MDINKIPDWLKKEDSYEKIFLIFIFALLLWMCCVNQFSYKINHEFPTGYQASDSFGHLSMAYQVYTTGQNKHLPIYISYGFEDAVTAQPPVKSYLTSIFAFVSGIELYDSYLLLTGILIAIGTLIIYLIIKDFNRKVAILSLPLSCFMFYKASYSGLLWGQMGAFYGSFFLIGFLWSMHRLNMKKSYLLVGLLLAATALAHPPEFTFGIGFVIAYFVYKLIFKKIDFNEIKKIFFGGIIAFLFSIYYLIIVQFTFAKKYGLREGIMRPEQSGFPVVALGDFSYFLIIIVIGMVLSFFYLKKKKNTAILIGFYLLIIGFGNYFRLGERAFQTRTFWPLYLSIFLGLGLYQIIRLIPIKTKLIYTIAISLGLCILFVNAYYQPTSYPGLMTKYHWDSFTWIKENTPKDAEVFYFHGDSLDQTMQLAMSQRISYIIDKNDFQMKMASGKIEKIFQTSNAFQGVTTNLAYRKGLFSFGYHILEKNFTVDTMQDICNVDYWVFDRGSRYPILAQYNIEISQKLLEKGEAEMVYSNDITYILKNNLPGGDCIGN